MQKKKIGKKVLAVVLTASMVAGYFPTLKKSVLAAGSESVAFDEDHVVLKMGVMSDIHLSYAYHSAAQIKTNVENYAKAVGTLNAMSGNDLDVLMLAGDYTSYGCYAQGKTFASASQAIMDEINKDKADDDKTQFFFTYGNHDTEWTGQMSYANWEKLLGEEYRLLDGVTKGPENTGCYKYTKTVDGKTYYFFSVETERYNAPSNMFCNEVLEWLDEELSKTPTDAYTYVVSHGPIKETGVYGADIEYEKNADWGTAEDGYTQEDFQRNTDGDTSTWNLSSDINRVLERYPQVVYFSGHTHMTNELESTIMSEAYTAITVSQYYTSDLYSSVTKYLDDGQNMTRPGYSLYVEVDKNGNQRITRVNTKDSTLVDSVTVEGTENSVANPSTADAATYPNIHAYYTTKVSMTTNSSGSAKTLKPWTMKAPATDKSHLTTYSASTRKENPVFNNGELTIDKMLNNSGESMTFTYTFPTAHCTDSHVIRYNLTLYTSDGNALDTQWILGDWTDNTDGVTESGKTHFDATTLTYSVTYDGAKFIGVTDVYAKVTAVNEFGGKTTLSSEQKDASQAVGIMKPTAVDTNKNMFDGLSAEDVICNLANTVSSTFDYKGRATTVINTTTNAEVIYDLSDTSSIGGAWGRVTRYGRSSTDLDVEDTFVYQTDFSMQRNTGIYFTFRATESADSHWKADYSGVYMDQNGIYLKLNQETVASNNGFKLTDTETHKLLIVSAPTTVSVWVDDCMVFSNQPYDVTQAKNFSGEGTSENPYKHNDITLQNTDMVPVIGFYVTDGTNGAEFTVSNQYLYVYDQQAQVKADWKATEVNLFDADKITAEGSILNTGDETYPKPKVGTTSLVAYAKYDSASIYSTGIFSLDLSSAKPTKEDTIITEFDYTATGLDCGSDNSSVLHDIEIHFRSTESSSMKFLLRMGTNFMDYGDGYHENTSAAGLSEGVTSHIKIVSEPTKVSVYVDGKLVRQGDYIGEGLNMTPCFKLVVRNGRYEFNNISIRKEDGSAVLDEVTPVTKSNNLLNGDYGQITSSFKGSSWEGKSNSVVGGNNFYTDLTWQNLEANGVTSFYMGENFYPFGSNNEDSPLKGTESIVTSALVRVANAENGEYNHRFGMTVADYNGTELWFFVSQTTLHVLTTDADATKFIASIDLQEEIGYQAGDYVRMTTEVNPYGFDIYMNGVRLYHYAGSDGQNVSYAGMKWMANGTSVRFLDASVSYNYDNVTAYQTGLQAEIDSYETLKGVYFENTDKITAQINKVKQAYSEAKKSSDLWSYVGTISTAAKTAGKTVNNFVYDGTTAVGLRKSIDLDGTNNTAWSFVSIPLFDEKTCPFTETDTWIVEADVTVVKAWMNPRIGFSLRKDANPDVMIQHADEFYYASSSNGWKTLTDTKATENIKTGSAWHVKYIVRPNVSIQTIVTSQADGTEIASYRVAWNLLRTISKAEYAPALYFACADVEVSNIYAGYDLSDDAAALKQAVTAAEQKDLSVYTWESVEDYKVAFDSTKKMNAEVQDYLGNATETVYTTPYSRKEMNEKVTELATAGEKLVTATATAVIGTSGVGNGTLSIGVANGTELPTKQYVDDKYYVIGWTYNGTAVTTVDNVAYIDQYIPEYIDLDMLQVKKQMKANKDNPSAIDIRFISSVNTLDYEKAGLVFSVYNEHPTVGGSKCVNKEISKVYHSLYAEGDKQTAENIYGNQYSKYLFAYEYLGFDEGEKVYVCAYVKLKDGTIVYGNARTVTATLLQAK